MNPMNFEEKTEEIAAADPRYSREAYDFLRDALEATLKKRRKARREQVGHVNAEQLLEGFREHALREFGPMAMTVLDYWGVRSCEDIGNMVFNLVTAGVFGKTDDDTLDSFRMGYEFREVFVDPFRPGSKI
jgi:uncharacterized repeat protein (TIGR04138 family)